jgi:hypothetical protein
MEEQQSTLAPQRMKSKLSKWWKKNKKAVIGIVATVLVAVVIGVLVATYAPALVGTVKTTVTIASKKLVIPLSAKTIAGIIAAGRSLDVGKKLCKDSWKKGEFCVGGGFKKVPIDYSPPEEERVRQERIAQCRAAWEGNPTQEQLCIGKV